MFKKRSERSKSDDDKAVTRKTLAYAPALSLNHHRRSINSRRSSSSSSKGDDIPTRQQDRRVHEILDEFSQQQQAAAAAEDDSSSVSLSSSCHQQQQQQQQQQPVAALRGRPGAHSVPGINSTIPNSTRNNQSEQRSNSHVESITETQAHADDTTATTTSVAYEVAALAVASPDSERRFRVDDKGFCVQHPDVRVKKRMGIRRKMTNVIECCPRCQVEWELDMEERRRRLEWMTPVDTTNSAAAGTNRSSTTLDKEEQVNTAIREAIERDDLVAVVAAMQQCPWSAKVQRSACAGLMVLAAQKKRNPATVASVGGVEAVFTAMRAHPQDVDLQRQACGALMVLARKDQNKVSIAASGGIGAVLAAMRNHLGDDACSALGNLARNKENQVTIASCGGVGAIISAMQAHPDDPKVQSRALGAMDNLARNEENKVTIASSGGIRAIVMAMKRFPEEVWVQHHGCGALARLASQNNENKRLIASAGGIDAIVTGMKKNPKQIPVQVEAFDALACVCSSSVDNASAIVSLGGIEAILATLRCQFKVTRVYERGLFTLDSLTRYEESSIAIAKTGGIDVIVAVMKSHPKEAKLQERACCALRNLARNDENKALIAASDEAIIAIRTAICGHPHKVGMQQEGGVLLYDLSLTEAGLAKLRVERDELIPALEAVKSSVGADCQDSITKLCDVLSDDLVRKAKDLDSQG